MSTRPVAPDVTGSSSVRTLVGAAHAGPTLAVTVLTGLLSVAQGLAPATTALLVGAVLAGQLSVGWSNDLVDRTRDRDAGRRDKPLATGAVSVAVVRTACGAAVLHASLVRIRHLAERAALHFNVPR